MWHLVCLQGCRKGEKIGLNGNQFTIGRGDNCDIIIPGDPSLAQAQAEITYAGSGFAIRDLDSACPTLVNGYRIDDSVLLIDRDTLQIGESVFRIENAVPETIELPAQNDSYVADFAEPQGLKNIEYKSPALGWNAKSRAGLFALLSIVIIAIAYTMALSKTSGALAGGGEKTNVIAAAIDSRCRMNLRAIEAAKSQWAMSEGITDPSDEPTMDELSAYMDKTPKCPRGGEYVIGDLETPPYCTVHGDPGENAPILNAKD